MSCLSELEDALNLICYEKAEVIIDDCRQHLWARIDFFKKMLNFDVKS
jgi:hypothetical protein